jgi:hypothetical protein
MEQIFKQLIELATEMRDWGKGIRMPFGSNTFDNIRLYYAANHSSVAFFRNYMSVIDVFFSEPVKIDIQASVLTTEALQSIYDDMKAEFEALKFYKEQELIEKYKEFSAKRIKELQNEIEHLNQ